MQLERTHLQTVTSTNDWLKSQEVSWSQNKIVGVSSDEQTKGRGRRQNDWFSPKGSNIYVSYGFLIPPQFDSIHNFAQMMALVVCVCMERVGLEAKIKWPNDVLIDGKKISGVLVDVTQIAKGETLVIIGTGINVDISESELESLGRAACSIFSESGKVWEKEDLLLLLEEIFLEYLEDFLSAGFEIIWEEFIERCSSIGSRVKVHSGNSTYLGILKSLSSNGSLCVELEDGSEKHFLSAEII